MLLKDTVEISQNTHVMHFRGAYFFFERFKFHVSKKLKTEISLNCYKFAKII